MSNRLQELAPYLLNRIQRRHNHTMQSKLREAGWMVTRMRVIASPGVFCSLARNEHCVRAVTERSTMSRALAKIEERSLVERTAPKGDPRARHLADRRGSESL